MRQNNGFTLIELLVVISIIGILAAIVLSSLNSARGNARDARRLSDVKQIELALYMLADSNNGNYPSTADHGICLGTSGTCWNGSLSGNVAFNTALQKFLPNIPTDPSGRSGKGDRYIYSDESTTVSLHCSGGDPHDPVLYPPGPYILWVPEDTTPHQDSLCKNVGFHACCGLGFECPEDYFCAYKINQ